MIFTRCQEPTTEQSLHRATPAQLAEVGIWGPGVFTHEVLQWLGVGVQKAVKDVTSALTAAMVKRMAINDTEFLPPRPVGQLEVSVGMQRWFARASLALALSRTAGEIWGTYFNLDQVLRIDFDWEQPDKGGVHVAKIALASLGIATPKRGGRTWYEGTEVFVEVTEADPTDSYSRSDPLFSAGNFATLHPAIKREAWESAARDIPAPRRKDND